MRMKPGGGNEGSGGAGVEIGESCVNAKPGEEFFLQQRKEVREREVWKLEVANGFSV